MLKGFYLTTGCAVGKPLQAVSWSTLFWHHKWDCQHNTLDEDLTYMPGQLSTAHYELNPLSEVNVSILMIWRDLVLIGCAHTDTTQTEHKCVFMWQCHSPGQPWGVWDALWAILEHVYLNPDTSAHCHFMMPLIDSEAGRRMRTQPCILR